MDLRGVLQPLTQKPAIDPCLTEEMREDAAHYVAQLQRFSVQVDKNRTAVVPGPAPTYPMSHSSNR